MKHFFNVMAGKDGTACVLLYGNIGSYGDDVRSEDIVSELMEIEDSYKQIDVRINSMGGEVFAGIAIFNALHNSKANIHIYVDGIAASIASVIAACGKPVHMSRYSRIMVHSITGGCYGNKDEIAKCIEEIKSLEDTLADIYANRCNKTKDEIKAAYFDGTDHWFSAQEALNAGLIDDIYDTDPVPENSTNQQIYNIYLNRLNRKDMIFEALKKNPLFANCTNDDEAIAIINRLATESGQLAGLKTKNTELENELKVYRDKAEAETVAHRTALIDAAVKDGRISEADRSIYENLLKADPENGEKALSNLKPQKDVLENLGTPPVNEGGAWEKRMKEIEDNNKKKKACY